MYFWWLGRAMVLRSLSSAYSELVVVSHVDFSAPWHFCFCCGVRYRRVSYRAARRLRQMCRGVQALIFQPLGTSATAVMCGSGVFLSDPRPVYHSFDVRFRPLFFSPLARLLKLLFAVQAFLFQTPRPSTPAFMAVSRVYIFAPLTV